MSFILPLLIIAMLTMAAFPGSAHAADWTSSEPTEEPSHRMIAVGDIAACYSTGDEQVAAMVANMPGTIATLGDTVYTFGYLGDYFRCFQPSWGPLKSRIRPAIGNHEYLWKGGSPFFNYFRSAAGPRHRGYYSYDLGSWHIVVINSNCAKIGGCGPGSPQYSWLRRDLRLNRGRCSLAYWHHPRYSIGRMGPYAGMKPVWNLLYRYGTEAVLTGHDHNYQRYTPIGDAGVRDTRRGIREFVVGTGGASKQAITRYSSYVEASQDDYYGVLKLDLYKSHFSWEFVSTPDGAYSDSGEDRCH